MSASGDDPAAARARELLRSVWVRQRDTVFERVALIEAAAAAAAAGTLGGDERAAARRETHKLAGSAGTFGFGEASVVARELEQAFDAPGPVADPAALVERAAALRRALDGEPAP